MRGISSILFSRTPDTGTYTTGLIVLSCSDIYDERIARRCCEWLPHVQWTIIRRFEPGFSWFQGETIFSSYADTTPKMLALVRQLRGKKFDIAVLAGTNELSYMPLKLMAIFSGFKSLAIFNENIDAYFACKDNHRIMVNHLRWRLSQKKILRGNNLLLAILSRVFLFPLAIIYILLRTGFLVIRKQLRST